MVLKLPFLVVQFTGIGMFTVLGSENTGISLKSFIGGNKITLVCEVKTLFLQVEFMHNSKPFRAYCLPPQPRPLCSRYKDEPITQNLETNCTTLVLNSHKKKYYGTWSCKHGLNRDKSEKVNIRKQDISRLHDVGITTFSIILIVLLTLTFLISYIFTVKRRCQSNKQDKEGPRESMLDSRYQTQ